MCMFLLQCNATVSTSASFRHANGAGHAANPLGRPVPPARISLPAKQQSRNGFTRPICVTRRCRSPATGFTRLTRVTRRRRFNYSNTQSHDSRRHRECRITILDQGGERAGRRREGVRHQRRPLVPRLVARPRVLLRKLLSLRHLCSLPGHLLPRAPMLSGSRPLGPVPVR